MKELQEIADVLNIKDFFRRALENAERELRDMSYPVGGKVELSRRKVEKDDEVTFFGWDKSKKCLCLEWVTLDASGKERIKTGPSPILDVENYCEYWGAAWGKLEELWDVLKAEGKKKIKSLCAPPNM